MCDALKRTFKRIDYVDYVNFARIYSYIRRVPITMTVHSSKNRPYHRISSVYGVGGLPPLPSFHQRPSTRSLSSLPMMNDLSCTSPFASYHAGRVAILPCLRAHLLRPASFFPLSFLSRFFVLLLRLQEGIALKNKNSHALKFDGKITKKIMFTSVALSQRCLCQNGTV